MEKKGKFWISIALILTMFIIALSVYQNIVNNETEVILTEFSHFSTTNSKGETINTTDFQGEKLLIHFTNLETPLCLECAEIMEKQTRVISKLVESDSDINVITINIRTNDGSEEGWVLAKRYWNIKVTKVFSLFCTFIILVIT